MKTTKSLVPILLALLTTQAAFAWYDPSTQRWLSRDPIGEPGFEALRAAATMPKTGIQISQLSSRWIVRDSIRDRGAANLYEFVLNGPINNRDIDGLKGDIPGGGDIIVPGIVGGILECIARQRACDSLQPGQTAYITTPLSALAYFTSIILSIGEQVCNGPFEVKVMVSKDGSGDCSYQVVIICQGVRA